MSMWIRVISPFALFSGHSKGDHTWSWSRGTSCTCSVQRPLQVQTEEGNICSYRGHVHWAVCVLWKERWLWPQSTEITCSKSCRILTATLSIGNCLPLGSMPEGTVVCAIEEKPGDRGKLAKASGNYGTVIAHNPDTKKTRIKLPSGSKKVNCMEEWGKWGF